MPHLAIGRAADEDAGVIPLLARNRREPPFHVEHVVGENLVQPQPLMAAVTLADQVARGRIERPLRFLVELARRGNRSPHPAIQRWPRAGEHVDPATRVFLEPRSALLFGPPRQAEARPRTRTQTIVNPRCNRVASML